MQPIDKKHKKIGIIIGVTFNALIIIASFQSCDKLNPPIEEPDPPLETIAVMDFTDAGGGKSGGSETIKEKPEQDAAPKTETKPVTDPEPETVTQTEPSPVTAKPAAAESSESDGEGSSQTPANDFGSLFGGTGGGEDGGSGGGSGDAIGVGDGPSTGGNGSGEGDGSKRQAIKKPSITNPSDQVGDIYVKLVIDRDGNVLTSTLMRNHDKTTAGMTEAQFKIAKEKSKDYKFNKVSSDEPAKQGLYVTIKFRLD